MDDMKILWFIFMTCGTCFFFEKRTSLVTSISAAVLIMLFASIMSAFDIVPKHHLIYELIQKHAMPVGLFLLMIGIDYKGLKKISLQLWVIFIFGIAANFIGCVIFNTFFALSASCDISAVIAASYVGGGENALAIKNYLNVKDEIFFNLFAVDNLLTTFWMLLCLAFVRFSVNNKSLLIKEKYPKDKSSEAACFTAFLLALTAHLLSHFYILKYFHIHPIISLSILALFFQLFGPSLNFIQSANKLGNAFFGIFFFTIGACVNISDIHLISRQAMLLPLIVLFVHIALMSLLFLILKIPFLHILVVSQALIGGPATAAAVSSQAGSKELTSIGVLLGSVGYGIGNLIGAGTYYLLNWMF